MLDSKPLHHRQNKTGLSAQEATQPIALPFRVYLRICREKKEFDTCRELPIIIFFLS